MRHILVPAAILSLGLAACGSPDDQTADPAMNDMTAAGGPARVATTTLMTADGEDRGEVTASEVDGSLEISLQVRNMEPGEYGVHVHDIGLCEAPGFTSAGPHWNPEGQSHGLESPDGQHAGDMPNVEVGADGTGSLQYTLAGGATFDGLMDADGSAFVVHAGRDDQVTDPSGDSGDRVACGVFAIAGPDTTGAM